MELGMIGLGRMGASMVRRLLRAGFRCVVYDLHSEAVAALVKEGAIGAATLEDFAGKLSTPRTVWLMVPAAVVDPTLSDLIPHLEAGDAVIAKRTALGDSALSPLERLIYCVWVADYGMRNAGDLETACDLYPDFQREAAHLAGELGLGFTHGTFSLPTVAMRCGFLPR